jgi:hypothetical protein
MSWTLLAILAAAVAVFYLICWVVDLLDRIRSLERLGSTLERLHEKLGRLECRLTVLETGAPVDPRSGMASAHDPATEG